MSRVVRFGAGALAGLHGRGEAIRGPGGWQLADPLFEAWLADRGLL